MAKHSNERSKTLTWVKKEDLPDFRRKTTPFLNRYEIAKIEGTRARNLDASGWQPIIPMVPGMDALAIAHLERKEKKIPVLSVRVFPNGTVDKVAISEMESLY